MAKISGPFFKPRPAPEPRVDSAEGRPGSRRGGSVEGQTVAQRIRPGGSNSNNVLVSDSRPRDGFDSGVKPKPALRLNDNSSRGPGGYEAAPTVQAGSPHTLSLRLGSRQAETNGGKIRFDDTKGIALGERPPGGGIEAPSTPTAPIERAERGIKRTSFLTKDALQALDRPELTEKLVNKLAKAKTLEKVARITRMFPPDLQRTIMQLASIRPGSSNANNILV